MFSLRFISLHGAVSTLPYVRFPDLIECGVRPLTTLFMYTINGVPLLECFNQSTGLHNIMSHFMGVAGLQGYRNLYSAEVVNNFDNICRLVNLYLMMCFALTLV